MALFKIEKGLKENLPINRPNAVEGYCYFTTNDKKFYIDIAGPNEDGSPLPAEIGVNRVCLNAEEADKLTAARSINGVPFDGTTDITNYAVCDTGAGIPIKVINLTGFKVVEGAHILVKFTEANASSNPQLNINDDIKPLMLTATEPMGSDSLTNGWPAGAVIPFTCDGAQWIRDYWYNELLYKMAVQINMAQGNDKKEGICSFYNLNKNRYFLALVTSDNTYTVGPMTLSINSEKAKTIYINGEISGVKNNTLPAGMYIVHYDGIGYHFRTDGRLPGIEVDSLGTVSLGNATQPIYFDNGKPTACSNLLPLEAGENHKLIGPLGFTEGTGSYGTAVPSNGFDGQLFFAEESETTYPIFYSDSVTLTESMNSVTIPTKIQSPCNSGNYDMLVYYNGLLLIKNTNYTESATDISLTSWTAKNGDTFTFLALLNNTKALSISYDTSNFYTKAEVDAKFSELKKLIQ